MNKSDIKKQKLERFERLAEKRVSEVLKRLRLVANLSNRRNYSYSEEHVRQIIDAIDKELRQVRSRFQQEGEQGAHTFSFRK